MYQGTSIEFEYYYCLEYYMPGYYYMNTSDPPGSQRGSTTESSANGSGSGSRARRIGTRARRARPRARAQVHIIHTVEKIVVLELDLIGVIIPGIDCEESNIITRNIKTHWTAAPSTCHAQRPFHARYCLCPHCQFRRLAFQSCATL